MEKTTFTRLFDPFDRSGAGVKFRPLRQSAREHLRQLPFPSARTEDWRFTNVAPILQTPFELPAWPAAVDAKSLPAPAAPDAIRLVLVNGQFVHALSSLGGVPAGVKIGSLADAYMAAELSPLTQIASVQDQVFTALNASFLQDGAFVVVPDGMAVQQPIEIIYVTQPAGKSVVTHPHTLLLVGRAAQATLVERYLTTSEGTYFTNAVTEIMLAEQAVVDHVKLQQESLHAFHVANTQVVQAGHSQFTTHALSLGSALMRNEVRVRFDADHSEATVNGLYLAGGKQHLDNYTVIDHAKPHCASHELYKGILDNQAHGVFNGKIFVRKDAQKTDAKQTNKVLLLADGATINTKPQLEIFADDVKCTHGATVGQLDANQLFYLQSRGIPQSAARRLLTFAFANDIVSRIKIKAIREQLEQLIVR